MSVWDSFINGASDLLSKGVGVYAEVQDAKRAEEAWDLKKKVTLLEAQQRAVPFETQTGAVPKDPVANTEEQKPDASEREGMSQTTLMILGGLALVGVVLVSRR